jgi:hypothetical protein
MLGGGEGRRPPKPRIGHDVDRLGEDSHSTGSREPACLFDKTGKTQWRKRNEAQWSDPRGGSGGSHEKNLR